MKKSTIVIIAGIIIGAGALLLTQQGNPANMGVCTACFLRDSAGALGLHSAEKVQYLRPEIIGIVIGAGALALFLERGSSAQGGSSPVTRFVLGTCVMIGALIFLGCPLRMVLRIAGGDLNAIVGLVGFVVGIVVGVFFLNRGFSLKRTHKQPKIEKSYFILAMLGLLILLLVAPALFKFSQEGPGSMHAPLIISLVVGLVIGGIAFKSRMCFVSGIRDSILFKDYTMLFGLAALLVVVLVGNLVFGKFNLSFIDQPIAHTDGFFNFAGMLIVGFGSTLLGGCPLRQLVLASSGNSDSVFTVFGLIFGAALSHNFQLASSAEGVSTNGQIAFWICLVILLAIAFTNSKKLRGGN